MQKLILNTAFGMVEISADHETDIIKKAAFWLSIPAKCSLCESPLVFSFETPQDYKYYKLRCTGPTPHAISLGEKKDTHDLYFDRSKKWEIWRVGQTEDQSAAAAETAKAPDHPNDPNSNRGKMLNRILELAKECKAKGLNPGDVSNLGKRTDAELREIGVKLAGMIAGENEVPK
jgi:hypothetical protein